MTSGEHRDPTVASTTIGQEVERRDDVPMPRKHAASVNAVGEWEAKQMQSPHPSVASPVSSPPAAGMAEQARRSEERACTRTLPELVPARDS